MSDDILDNIDAAVEAAREDSCACGCWRLLEPDGPSPYFAGPDCQTSWYLQQQAIAASDVEQAEEMRRQRGEDPLARLRRRVSELGDEERAERDRRRLRVVDWLRANGIDPMRVAQNYPIITTPTSIIVHDYTRDEQDQVCLVDGEVETVEEMYPLVTPWPADLELEDHRHEADEEALDDRRPDELSATVAMAASLLGHGVALDATTLLNSDPLAYRPRCTTCGRRGIPITVEVEQFGVTVPRRLSWTCEGCSLRVAGVTATVERFSQAAGLHLRLGYGRELVHYVLPDRQLGSHDSLDPIWREMEKLLATSVRLPWSDPRSNPLADMREVVERERERGRAAVLMAPFDTPADDAGWVDIGWTAEDGLVTEEAEQVVVGFDGAHPDASLVMARSHHGPGGGQVTAIDVSAPTHEEIVARWAGLHATFRLAAEQVTAMGAAFATFFDAVRPLRLNDPMLRAIEAKKSRGPHGPQKPKRAPRRIDPRRGR